MPIRPSSRRERAAISASSSRAIAAGRQGQAAGEDDPDNRRKDDAEWNADPEAALVEAAGDQGEQHARGDGKADEADGDQLDEEAGDDPQDWPQFLRLALGKSPRRPRRSSTGRGRRGRWRWHRGWSAGRCGRILTAPDDAACVPGDDGREHEQRWQQ